MTREEIRKKANYNRRQKSQGNRELNVRQAQVLTYLALGKRVREIARELNVSDDSIRRDIRRLEETKTYDNRLKIELEKHCLLWNKAFACVEANLDSGNLKAAEDVMKYTGVWIDRLDVIAKVEPGDQQKKMMENMETLLKLSKDKVQGALSEKTVTKELHPIPASTSKVERMKELQGETKETEKPEYTVKGIKDVIEFEENMETQSQLGSEKKDPGVPDHLQEIPYADYKPACTCPADRDNPVNIDLRCPVHGSKDKKQAVFNNPKSPKYGQVVDLPSGDNTDDDKKQGGGHPPPGGADV